MLTAKNEKHLRKLLPETKNVIEEDEYFWAFTDKGAVRVLKTRPIGYIKQKMVYGRFPEKYIKGVLKKEKKKTKALQIALQSKRGFLLSGKAGIGKTFAAIYKIALLIREYQLNHPLYVSLQNFDITELRKNFRDFDSYLLDDLNLNLNEWEKKMVNEIIYHSYNEDKKIFITTNASFKDLATFLNEEPLVSRLLEMCEIKELKENEDLRIVK